VPLSSIPSSRSWGIGEIGDIAGMTTWLLGAGQRLLQLLPITETAPGDTSPYSALSAMAIDPQFISLEDVEDVAAIGGESGLDRDQRATLDRVRRSPQVDYHAVRGLKRQVQRRAFEHFLAREWTSGSARARVLRAFVAEQAWWLDDYALFRVLHARHDERAWMDWPAAVRDRHPEALAAARQEHAVEVLYRQYLQWLAGEQWASARACAGEVALFGDLPFMVSGDSADVWARQDEFCLDYSVGTPPDLFSETGQDWGLPPYRWDIVAAGDFEWLRQRARRTSDLFDGCRVDHLVGFYRTFVRSREDGEALFTPEGEAAQLALGEQVLAALAAPGLRVVAEDLGVVPDFVRASLARLGIPGYKVMRWERRGDESGQPFLDPADYPAVAVATSGTHDHEPMVVWWAEAPEDERTAVLEMPSVRARLAEADVARARTEPDLSPALRAAIVEALIASGADLLILPVQDVFGWSGRINEPATVGDHNWTWRLPWPSDRLPAEPEAQAVSRQLHKWSSIHGRR
jgi:4-alpha-glucanotransferase